MSKLVYSEEEIDGMKKDFERIDKIYSEALDLSNKKSYKSAIKSQFHILYAMLYTLEKHVGARKALAKLDMKDYNVKTSLYHFVNGLCHYYEDALKGAISGFGEAKKEMVEAKAWYDKEV